MRGGPSTTAAPAVTRRRLLQLGALAGGALLVPRLLAPRSAGAAPLPGGTLDPVSIPKYAHTLAVPSAMPRRTVAGVDHYEIALRQFPQQMLPRTLPRTTVWGYGSVRAGATGPFATPTAMIEATHGVPVRVKWINGLVDSRGRSLPHLLPVDPTLHWANPPGGVAGRDSRPWFAAAPGPYTGPVPTVPHVHGAHVDPDSDGHPEAWYLPAAADLPRGYATEGTWYDRHAEAAARRFGAAWSPGSATFQYRNDQAAAMLWFHDHALGMARAAAYAGAAGLYVVRGGPNDVPDGVLPGGTREVPLVIQDRSFNRDGSLFYPDSRAFFDGFGGPYIGDGSNVPPIWNPEFFGNTMLVNGRTWPAMPVAAGLYRFRILNACGSRFTLLKLAPSATERPAAPMLRFLRIGGDGGFLRAPVAQEEILLAPSERADVVVDFRGLRPGTEVFLVNEGPDKPFRGGRAPADFAFADPATTGQVMKFVVTTSASGIEAAGAGEAPLDSLALPAAAPPAAAAGMRVRRVSLNELTSTAHDGPAEARLGTVGPDDTGSPLTWADRLTETPARDVPELWEIVNWTDDAHPIHLHQAQVAVVDRQPVGGRRRPPAPWEEGPKDTVIAYPGEITRLRATFDIAGGYVWHSQLLEHQDNAMMRPLEVR